MARSSPRASPGPTPSHPIPPGVNDPPEVESEEPVKEPGESPPASEPPDTRNPARMVFSRTVF